MPFSSNLRPLGYQQITSLTTATGLTIPAGSAVAIITCSGTSVRWRDDGTNPTSSVGYPLPVGAELVYSGSMPAIKFIETTASAALDICYYGA